MASYPIKFFMVPMFLSCPLTPLILIRQSRPRSGSGFLAWFWLGPANTSPFRTQPQQGTLCYGHNCLFCGARKRGQLCWCEPLKSSRSFACWEQMAILVTSCLPEILSSVSDLSSAGDRSTVNYKLQCVQAIICDKCVLYPITYIHLQYSTWDAQERTTYLFFKT